MTPTDFFTQLARGDTSLSKLNKRLQAWSDTDIAKVIAFVDIMEKRSRHCKYYDAHTRTNKRSCPVGTPTRHLLRKSH